MTGMSLAVHRIEVTMQGELRFRLLMEENGYHVPAHPHSTSMYPKLAFVIEAPPWERFDFLRPDILPPH